MVAQNPSSSASTAMAKLTIVELSDNPAGELTAKLMANLGARVIKLEPPSGSPSRHIGPFVLGSEDIEQSLNFWYYNDSKESITLDLQSSTNDAVLASLLEQADIFIYAPAVTTDIPDFLSVHNLATRFPSLISCFITPFGLTGEWSSYRTSDLVSLAAGGPLFTCGYDDHSLPPIRPGGGQSYHCAAIFAFNSILLALLHRDSSRDTYNMKEAGRTGQIIDVPIHDCLVVTTELSNPYWSYTKSLVQRQTCRHATPVMTNPGIVLCSDNLYVYFMIIIAELKPWKALVSWMIEHELAVDLVDDAYLDAEYRREHYPHIHEVVDAFASLMDSETFFNEAQRRGLPAGKIYAPEDFQTDPQLLARKFFAPVDCGLQQQVAYPGPPYRFSDLEWAIRSRPPLLGQHNAGIFGNDSQAQPDSSP